MRVSLFHVLNDSKQPVRGSAIAWLLLVYGALWLAVLGGTALVPPMDNIEQLVWVRKLQWGYYKHPPLPTALLWPWVQLFGVQVWETYLLGAALTLGTLGWMWRWLRQVTDSRFATLALLAVLCITFYAGRLYYYNHNITLLWGTVGAAICAWHALQTQRLHWWLALGLVLGLAALGKYQIGLSVLSLLAYMAWSGAWRVRRHVTGLLLAGAVALVVFAPHAWWALEQRSNPLNYALATSLEAEFGWQQSLKASTLWLLDQFFNRALLAWLWLGFGAWHWRKRQHVAHARGEEDVRAQGALPDVNAAMLHRFLMCFGLLPFAVMLCMGLFAGADLQLHWGTAYLPLAVPAVMVCWRSVDWPAVLTQLVWRGFVLVQTVLLAQVALSSAYGPSQWRSSNWRTFDAPRVAREIAPRARAALGAPVRVVVGGKEAGAIAMYLPERPLVLLGNNLQWSPWVPADLTQRCGAVYIDVDYNRITWNPQRSAAQEEAGRALGEPHAASFTQADFAAALSAAMSMAADSGTIQQPGSTIAAVRWMVLPPKAGAGPCTVP